jgi:membrane protein
MASSDVGQWQPSRTRPGMPVWMAVTLGLLVLGFRRAPYTADDTVDAAAHGGSVSGRRARREDTDGRGRSATSPEQIGGAGWKDILWRVYNNIGEHRLVAIAAGVTFYALLAIFPAIAALVSLYGLFADPSTIAAQLDNFSGVMPGGGLEVIRDQLTRVASQQNGTLGITFLTGLAVSLWSANAGIKSLFDALNLVYGEKEERGFIGLNLQSLAFTFGAIVAVLVALAIMVALPYVLDALGLGEGSKTAVLVVRWLGLLFAVIFGLALLYRFGPSRATPRWRWVSVGSTVAALLWLVVSFLFSWYTANFGNYNATYGSLGAVVGFMIWMWLSAIVILLGAELDAEMEHQTARDTTTGKPKPLGVRGARVADTVGAAQD